MFSFRNIFKGKSSPFKKKLRPRRRRPRRRPPAKRRAVVRKVSRRPKVKPPSVSQRKSTTPSAPTKTKEILIGEITHYFSRIGVVVVKMKGGLTVGDEIHIKGRRTDFRQNVLSLQIESVDVKAVRRGQLVGLKVKDPAREGDKIFKIG